jgi:outer membrane protein assembly factor BamA
VAAILNTFSRTLLIFLAMVIAESRAAPFPSDSVADFRGDTSSPAKKIVSISFTGNKTTRDNVLRMFLSNFGVAAGITYDTVKVNEIKRKLLMTNLFYKVDAVALPEGDGVHLYIIVHETFFWVGSGTGEYIRRTDGSDSWIRLSGSLQKQNFCGRMETVTLSGSVWRDRSLGLSWSKPLLPSKYSIGIGGSASYYPELNYPRERIVIRGRMDASRDFTIHTRGFASVVPSYSIIDTMVNQPFSLQRIHEAYTLFGWSTDYRNSNFDPAGGWYFTNEFLSNAFYSDDAIKYGQYSCDFRI